MTARGQRTGTDYALRFRAPDGDVAVAWCEGDIWQVHSKDAGLRSRVRDALRQPAVVASTHTEHSGERVLEGWKEVSPTDPRYPTLIVLQLSRVGLDDVEAELIPRAEAAAQAAHSYA